jgi:large subunit ribosomal protein L24
VTLGAERIALDDIQAVVEGEPLRGHLAYSFGGKQGTRLEAALDADKLDLETGFSFVKALSAGSHIEMPESIALSATIGRANFSGFSGRDAAADITYDKRGLTIRKLSVADLGGASLNVDGQLAFGTGSKQPGKLQADLRAPDLKPVLAVLSRVAPTAARALQPSERSPANLHAELTVRPSTPLNRTDVKLTGALGGMDLSLEAEAAADFKNATIGQTHLDARITAVDGRTLLPLLRLEHAVEVGDGPGALTAKANGKFGGPFTVSATATANGLDASVNGTADLSAQRSANLQIALRQANAAPLQGVSGTAPLPVSYTSQLVLKGDTLNLNGIKASVGTAKLNGKVTLGLGEPMHIAGALDVDTAFDGPATVAAALGSRLASIGRDGRWSWSSDPFLPSLFGKFDGDVQLAANRLHLLPTIEGRRFTGTLHFGPHEVAAREIKGEVAGGTLKGDLTFQQGADGVSLGSHLALSGADATVLIGSGVRPPLTGTMGFDVALEGTGLSPVALIGSLHGQGKVTLSDAQIAGLDAHAFDVVTRAVDAGVPIETARVTDIVGKALDSGALKVKQAEGVLSIAAGQVRLARVKAASDDVDLDASGTLDLTDGKLDSRFILSGAANASGLRPDIYMALSGPIAEPQRSVDVAALTGWLTLRAVELQTQKVKALEEAAAKSRADEEAAAKRGADEARRRAEEEAKRRADAAAKRRAAEELRRQADDEARLRALLGTPALDPAPAAQARPAEAAVTTQPSRSGPLRPAPGLLPLIESAPVLPPPVTISRPPGALPWIQ